MTKCPPFHRQPFQMHFLNETIRISIKILLNFVSKGQIGNIPALVEIMAWSAPSHYLNQLWLNYWHIYASFSLNELKLGSLKLWRLIYTPWSSHFWFKLRPSDAICNLTIIGPDNGLSPGRRQAIIWTNAGILLIGPWGTNFSEILIRIQTFSFKKMHLKISSTKWRPFRLGLNVLRVNNKRVNKYSKFQWQQHSIMYVTNLCKMQIHFTKCKFYASIRD